MFCPKCGKANPDDAEFCGKCGFRLQATKTVHEPRAGPSAAVSDELKVGIAIGSAIIPILGIIMGAIYMADANPAKKAAGKLWLTVGIAAGVLWCLIVAGSGGGF